MWSYVSGTIVKSLDEKDEKFVEKIEMWDAYNSKIITWINNSVLQSIGVQLAKYETGKEVWNHLERLYIQSNFAKQYQLEIDIRALQQNNMSIQEFYSAMTNLWDQLALTESAELRAFVPYIARREEQRLVQFLMALRDDFEGLRGTILHRNPLPTVESVVNELLAEEIRLKSLTGKGNIDKGILSIPNASVLAVPSKPFFNNQNKSDECRFCKQKGHWKAQCPKLLNRSQQQTQQFNQLKAPYQFQHRNFRPPSPNVAAVVPPVDLFDVGHAPFSGNASTSNPTVATLAEQFQKFLSTQRHAMTTSINKGLPSSGASGSTIQEVDWD